MIEPQHMLVEERGLERQIKRLKEILIGKGLNQLNSIIEELEAIKFSVKSENDRILKDKLKLKQLIRKEETMYYGKTKNVYGIDFEWKTKYGITYWFPVKFKLKQLISQLVG